MLVLQLKVGLGDSVRQTHLILSVHLEPVHQAFFYNCSFSDLFLIKSDLVFEHQQVLVSEKGVDLAFRLAVFMAGALDELGLH